MVKNICEVLADDNQYSNSAIIWSRRCKNKLRYCTQMVLKNSQATRNILSIVVFLRHLTPRFLAKLVSSQIKAQNIFPPMLFPSLCCPHTPFAMLEMRQMCFDTCNRPPLVHWWVRINGWNLSLSSPYAGVVECQQFQRKSIACN